MAAWDFAKLRRRVRESASLTTSDDDTVGDLVNEAYVDLCRDAGFGATPFEADLVADQDTYTFAAIAAASTPVLGGILSFRQLSVGAAGERLTEVQQVDDINELLSLRSSNVTPGKPWKAAVLDVDGPLVLYPIPSDAYVLSGIVVPEPVELELDGDTPVQVPNRYHRAIYYRAVQLAIEWDRQGDQDAATFEGRYMAQVGLARRERNTMLGGAPRALTPGSSLGPNTWPPAPFGSM